MDEDHDCFGKLTNQFASEGSPIFLPNISVVYFQEQIGFVLKMIIFSYMAYASVRESVRTRDVGWSFRHSCRPKWPYYSCYWIYWIYLIYCTVWDKYMQVLYLGRAPRTKETLPDFREKCRVTRHSRVFPRVDG